MKITVAGLGYVGLSVSVLLAQNHMVYGIDIDADKVSMVNEKVSPFEDKEIKEYLASGKMNLTVTTDAGLAYPDADYIIVATPTGFDSTINGFDTRSVESVIRTARKYSPNAVFVIKSTVPIGFTQQLIEDTQYGNILFCPEFLREGRALYDNLHPSRIIIGIPQNNPAIRNKAEEFTKLVAGAALKKDVQILYTGLGEAESIKLFANTYLAMRVSFFNELDTYAEAKGLSSYEIIKGVCLDPRIGDYYNNPSFGYGGYCLPKDTKQLLSQYEGIPQDIISSIVDSNDTRRDFIAGQIIAKKPDVVGIYRLIIKTNGDNFRASRIIDVMEVLKEANIKVVVYEPILEEDFESYQLIEDLESFKRSADVILANRYHTELDDVKEKVYTHDIFHRD